MILDGWGIRDEKNGNAVAEANTPFLDRMEREYPTTALNCSGEAVGLPDGVMGNSEVGHLNIGAGRIVYQDLKRIDLAIANGEFYENPVLNTVMDDVITAGGRLHLMGLVSDGGVHSQLTHLLALLDMARKKGVSETAVHAITDGRDTSPTGGVEYLGTVQEHIKKHQYGKIASVCGRYYAMDRDKRWERTERAYRLYTEGEGAVENDPIAAVQNAYDRGETDEFIQPVVIQADGEHVATVADGDGVIFFNFRADRARQITRAFTQDDFESMEGAFTREKQPSLRGYVTMTRYDETFTLPVAFPPTHLEKILGEVISENGLRQLRIAETEKYAHVTYFFNGGEETPFENEDRALIPSPRDVPTYDHKPEMSAFEVTDELLSRLKTGNYDVVVLNFANMDMVGHSGVIPAAVKACETVDKCAERIVSQVRSMSGAVLITADHGNSEMLLTDDGKPHTSHTQNPVRLILVDDDRKGVTLRSGGKLGDIAPTVLEIMGLPQPKEMTGVSLLIESA